MHILMFSKEARDSLEKSEKNLDSTAVDAYGKAKATLQKVDTSKIKDSLKNSINTDKLKSIVGKGVKKLPSQIQGVASKVIGQAGKKLERVIEPVYVVNKLRTPEGRAELAKRYSLTAPDGKSDTLGAMASDMFDAVTSPYSPSGLTALTRTLHRSQRGAKAHADEQVQAATRGDTERVRQLVDSDPRHTL